MKHQTIKVTSVEQLKDFDDEYVYDIEMKEEPHTFFANDILIHNSVMFDASGYVNKVLGERNTDLQHASREDVIAICDELDNLVNNDVNKVCRRAVRKECFTPDSNRIGFAREVFGPSAAFFKKKKYFVRVWDKEGISTQAFKYTGIEIKQTALPKPVKGLLQNIFEKSCIENWDNDRFQQEMLAIWNDFKKLEWEDVALYKGNNTFKEPESFLQVKKGTTGMSKACIYYDQLLEKLKLDKKYPKTVLGEKSRFAYVKPNSFGINVIAFPDQFPPEFMEFFAVDHNTMFEKMLLNPLKIYRSIRGWDQFNPGAIPMDNIFDL